MKSKEVDKVIEHLKETEKENINWKGKYHLLSRKIDVTPNQVIRDKIEELERRCMLLLNNYEKCDTCEKESCSIRGKYLILKELLG